MTWGALSLVPAAVVLLVAVWTRRPVESLLAGAVTGCLLLAPGDPLSELAGHMLAAMRNETVTWIILVCALFGSLVTLLGRVGAAARFGDAVAGRIGSRRGALGATWLLGLAVFIDDYLNVLAVSSSVRRVTDRHGVSREMLAYVVDSTAAPVCILVPLSTWAAFFAGLLEETGFAASGAGLQLYAASIPYMLYAWLAVALALAVGLGLAPAVGPMRRAERRAARETGPRASPVASARLGGVGDSEAPAPSPRARPWHFALPIVTLVAATWWFDLDILKGVMVALAVTLVMVAGGRLLSVGEALDAAMSGVLTMVVPLATVFGGFLLKEVNDALGLTTYVIQTVEPLMTPGLLPAVAFVTMSFVAFATASFWGVFAVAIPIVLPLADAVGAEMPLVIGALVSAGAFGSHACFYGDSTVLAARGAECGVVEHALTQLPYAACAAALAAVGFLLLA